MHAGSTFKGLSPIYPFRVAPRVEPAGSRPREIIDDKFHHVPRVAVPGPFRLRMGRFWVLEVAGQAAPAAFFRTLSGAEAVQLSGPLQLGDWVPTLC